MDSVRVGDAYVRATGAQWTIGTKAVAMTYAAAGQLRLIRFTNRLVSPKTEYVGKPPLGTGDGWTFVAAKASRAVYGGQPVAELEVSLKRDTLRAKFHVIAFPGTSVFRQWLDVENAGTQPAALPEVVFGVPLDCGAAPFTHYWMVGGNSGPEQGMLKSAPVGPAYHQALVGRATSAFVPWMAFQRGGAPGNGFFIALEYLSNWRMSVVRDGNGPVGVSVDVPDLARVPLAPGQAISLPVVTIGAFAGGLDDMQVQCYDWQYRYLWDYTNSDYYAKPKWAVPWVYCARNVQEQFAARLAGLDMDADLCRSVGFEMLWDDAGWGIYPTWPEDSYGTVFTASYEGPDFAQTLRYLRKTGMNWLAWFNQRPSSGVMDSKVGSWGDFEWRSDAVDFPDWAADQDWRSKILHFLDNHPRSSFHTCSGGSTYSHTFDIQRFANTNYFSDFGRGDQTNYYLSYLEPPDKWVDIIEPWTSKGKYLPETARTTMTMVPFWGLWATESDQELLRRDLEIYRFLLHEGVAGRWSYMFHPAVKGDAEFYYAQRTSHDRTKACIILKHKATGEVTISPRGLLPGHRYVVGFDSTQSTTTRTGADLMANGIRIEHQAPGELIYLGLPNRPRGGCDTIRPSPPGSVLVRRETNIGHSGVGVYWSAGADNNWVSYYEVRRGRKLLGKTTTGTYYFDHALGWDPDAMYLVRTVDGDGNTSEWVTGKRIAGEPAGASALGGLFPERGREGWSAETTSDGASFAPMTWVAPAKASAADVGGTPNQRGGIEGYWEGPGGARVGRGWQQAGSGAACVRTWTAPRDGQVQIVGRVMKEWYRQERGGPCRVRILLNERQVSPRQGWADVPLRDLRGATHFVVQTVARGDKLRFELEQSPDPENAIVAWMPWIVYVEPTPVPGGSVVRILCGAKKPYTDQTGNAWSADRFFNGGGTAATKAPISGATPTEADQALYRHGREGKEFTYAIPVEPGLYAVRLKFAEPKFEWLFQRPFNVAINGRELLRNFDICQDARGSRRADERVFRYVVPNAEGKIDIRFSGGFDAYQATDKAIVQAIEVLPERTQPVRIDCGSDTEFIDWNSFVSSADAGYTGGETLRSDKPVTQASPTLYDQPLYQTARSGKSLTYTISMPPGLYTVHLKFAELWLTEPGQRPMDIEINGWTMRKSWDPAAAAGQLGMAADIRADGITPDKDGHITIRLRAVGPNDAIIQGIEVE